MRAERRHSSLRMALPYRHSSVRLAAWHLGRLHGRGFQGVDAGNERFVARGRLFLAVAVERVGDDAADSATYNTESHVYEWVPD